MATNPVFLIATREEAGIRGLMRAAVLATVSGWKIARVDADPRVVATELRHGITTHRSSLAGALLRRMPREEQFPLLVEFPGRLLIDEGLTELLGEEIEHWKVSPSFEDSHRLVLEPDRTTEDSAEVATRFLEGADAYRRSLRSREPTVCRAPLSEVLERQDAWFGDLADSALGGATALITISMDEPDSRWVLLRNPAALRMRVIDEANTIAVMAQHGAIGVSGWGVTVTPQRSRDFAEQYFSRCSREQVMATLGQLEEEGLRTDYAALFALSASVDPTVRIPQGVVVQQAGLTGVQTLAAAGARSVVVGPSSIVPVAVPAWCLNKLLSPPNGQIVRATALQLQVDANADQSAVWALIDARLQSTRR